MKTLKPIILSIISTLALSACTDMDIPPKNIFSEGDIFGSSDGIESQLSRMYATMPMEDFRYSFEGGFFQTGVLYRQMCCATGEAVGRDTQSATAEPGPNMWNNAYLFIREVNNFIDVLEKYKSSYSAEDYNTYMGEAHFIRAYLYFALVKRFGGVPLVDYVINYPAEASLEDTWIPRASEDDCWQFVGDELEKAIELLPEKIQSGRANRYAAAALRSRAMLYAGSIAKYNNVEEVHNGTRICGINASRAEYYFTEAFLSAKKVDEGGYSLYKAKWAAGNPTAQAENFTALFLDESGANTESIFCRYYKEKLITHDYDNSVQPRQTSTGGNDSEVSPSVDFMEMFDGVPLDDQGHFQFLDADGHYIMYDNPMDAFANAEPRLLGTVILPMSEWKGQRIEIRRGVYTGSVGSGLSRLINEGETAAYETLNIPNLLTSPSFNGPMVALDAPYVPYPGAAAINQIAVTGPNGPVNGWNFGNIGGTYLRKYLDPTLSNNSGNQSTQHWIDLRYAEVLLNRSEAACELAKLGKSTVDGTNLLNDAYTCINMIRERAGANLLTSTGELSDINVVRKERRKELAFENHTYWDLRRWRILYDEQNNTRYRIMMPFFATDGNKYFFDIRFTEPRAGYQYIFTFDTRYYYQPMPSAELTKNPNLVNNPGF